MAIDLEMDRGGVAINNIIYLLNPMAAHQDRFYIHKQHVENRIHGFTSIQLSRTFDCICLTPHRHHPPAISELTSGSRNFVYILYTFHYHCGLCSL